MGDIVKNLTNEETNNIHCPPLTLQANHLIAEGYQVGQALFPLHKSILISPDHLLVFVTFGNCFQKDLLYHFSPDQG